MSPCWTPAGTLTSSSPSIVGTVIRPPSIAVVTGTFSLVTSSVPWRAKRSSASTRTST